MWNLSVASMKNDFQICLSPTVTRCFNLEYVLLRGWILIATLSLCTREMKDICVTTSIRVLCKHLTKLGKHTLIYNCDIYVDFQCCWIIFEWRLSITEGAYFTTRVLFKMNHALHLCNTNAILDLHKSHRSLVVFLIFCQIL